MDRHHEAGIVTLRQTAEMNSDKVISALKTSSLNYEMCETPYSVRITFRKRFITDRSPRSPGFDTSSPPPSWTTTAPPTRAPPTQCASCEEAKAKIQDIDESNRSLILSYAKLEQQFHSLLAQNGALRCEVETQSSLRQEGDNLVRAATDKVQSLLTENAELKNETDILRNLKFESDNLAKMTGDKVGELLKKIEDLKHEAIESRTNEEKSKVRIDTLMKERNNLKKEVSDKVEQLKRKNKKLDEVEAVSSKTNKDYSAKIDNLERTLRSVNHKCEIISKNRDNLKADLRHEKILLTKLTKKRTKLSKGTQVEDQAFEPPHPSSENSQTAKDILSDSNLDSNHKNVFDLPEDDGKDDCENMSERVADMGGHDDDDDKVDDSGGDVPVLWNCDEDDDDVRENDMDDDGGIEKDNDDGGNESEDDDDEDAGENDMDDDGGNEKDNDDGGNESGDDDEVDDIGEDVLVLWNCGDDDEDVGENDMEDEGKNEKDNDDGGNESDDDDGEDDVEHEKGHEGSEEECDALFCFCNQCESKLLGLEVTPNTKKSCLKWLQKANLSSAKAAFEYKRHHLDTRSLKECIEIVQSFENLIHGATRQALKIEINRIVHESPL